MSVTPTRRERRARRALLVRRVWAALAVLLVAGCAVVAVAAAVTAPEGEVAAGEPPTITATPPPTVQALPVPQTGAHTDEAEDAAGDEAGGDAAVETTGDLCADETFQQALAAGDDAAALAAAGGAEAFRAVVAAGEAPCVPLDDATHEWVVVNKQRPLAPIDYEPADRAFPDGVQSLSGGALRADTAGALAALAADAQSAGAGEIAMQSGYRSYSTQQSTYANHVSNMGQLEADRVSARPGYSEHQTGMAADVVACPASGCTSLDDLAGTAQGDWVAEHAWEYGFIVRYEDGYTETTGYSPEPWHLRYIGTELAAAYHDGGWHTLEDFFGLPAASDYVD